MGISCTFVRIQQQYSSIGPAHKKLKFENSAERGRLLFFYGFYARPEAIDRLVSRRI